MKFFRHLAIFCFLAFLSSTALASAAAEHGIPWELILKQSISFGLLAIILYVLLSKHIISFYAERAVSFEKLLVLARKAREDAETQKKEVLTRLQDLEGSANESIERARQEAEIMKAKIKAEAEQISELIRQEAKNTAEHEVAKAKAELKQEAVAMAILQSRESMRTSVAELDQTRLQNEFVEKIQVIR